MKVLSLIILTVVFCSVSVEAQKKVFDHHVNIMSPRTIKLFKYVNFPLAKPDADYSDWKSIAKRLGTKNLKLISMAYLYGHPEFGKVENDYESVKAKRCRKILKADGIKLHFNASQVYLTVPDHALKAFTILEFAAKPKLPVVLHVDNSHRKFGETDVNLLADEILAKIKPLCLQIVHFGTSGGFNRRTKGVIDASLKQFESNPDIKRHGITIDISAVALDKDSQGVPKLTDELFAELAVYVRRLNPRRVVFGTDYPLYSVGEYLEILRKRVKLTDKEISSFHK